MDEKISERIVKLEADGKNIFHQLDEIKIEVRDIRRLCAAVEKIAVKTESTAQKVNDISERLENVEKAPAEEFKHYKRIIYGCIITGTIGIILGALLAMILK